MKMVDFEKQCSVKRLGLYLTAAEAKDFHRELGRLLKDPEAVEHFHVYDKDKSREISCSIITKNKLKNIHEYTRLEQLALQEK